MAAAALSRARHQALDLAMAAWAIDQRPVRHLAQGLIQVADVVQLRLAARAVRERTPGVPS